MVVYDFLSNYDRYKNTFKNFKNVTVSKTKYSTKIDFGKRKVILTDTNKQENNNEVLKLINLTRKDANNYLVGNEFEKTQSRDIYWYHYNEMLEVDNKTIEVAKIDLNSAYWTKAINEGVIGKETVDFFESIKFENLKNKKKARLKALGSLATVKSIINYEYGKIKNETQRLYYDDNLRDLYLWICNEVSKDMQTLMQLCGGIYYYWDCIFVELDKIEAVKRNIEILGYKFTIENDIAEVFVGKEISYFYCQKTGIKYPLN